MGADKVPADGCRVYEQEAIRRVAGETIRPGGLELTDYALSHCDLPEGAKLLDVGCGGGATVAHCRERGLAAVGVDLSGLLLKTGGKAPGMLPLIQGSGVRLPLGRACVHALVAECSLSLMPGLEAALAEFYRVLLPGGWLVVSDLYARLPEGIPSLRALPLHCCVSSALSKPELFEHLRAQGFTLLLWEDRSEALKRFAAQLVWTHGSLEHFWEIMTHNRSNGDAVQCTISGAKPGYFLLIARK